MPSTLFFQSAEGLDSGVESAPCRRIELREKVADESQAYFPTDFADKLQRAKNLIF